MCDQHFWLPPYIFSSHKRQSKCTCMYSKIKIWMKMAAKKCSRTSRLSLRPWNLVAIFATFKHEKVEGQIGASHPTRRDWSMHHPRPTEDYRTITFPIGVSIRFEMLVLWWWETSIRSRPEEKSHVINRFMSIARFSLAGYKFTFFNFIFLIWLGIECI